MIITVSLVTVHHLILIQNYHLKSGKIINGHHPLNKPLFRNIRLWNSWVTMVQNKKTNKQQNITRYPRSSNQSPLPLSCLPRVLSGEQGHSLPRKHKEGNRNCRAVIRGGDREARCSKSAWPQEVHGRAAQFLSVSLKKHRRGETGGGWSLG